jgi:hypothetical protein
MPLRGPAELRGLLHLHQHQEGTCPRGKCVSRVDTTRRYKPWTASVASPGYEGSHRVDDHFNNPIATSLTTTIKMSLGLLK